MKPKRKSIADYRFEDSKVLIFAIVAMHLIFFIILGTLDWSSVSSNGRAMICLSYALVLLGAHFLYDWTSPAINILFTVLYLVFLFYEFYAFGIPQASPKSDSYISNGVFMEMFLWGLPYVYIGLRVGLVYPLIKIYLSSRKVG